MKFVLVTTAELFAKLAYLSISGLRVDPWNFIPERITIAKKDRENILLFENRGKYFTSTATADKDYTDEETLKHLQSIFGNK